MYQPTCRGGRGEGDVMTLVVKKCCFLAFIAMADNGTLLTSRMATADSDLSHCSKTPEISHCLMPLGVFMPHLFGE